MFLKPGQGFHVALPLKIMPQHGIGIGGQLADQTIQPAGGINELLEMGGGIAITQGMIGHDIQPILHGIMQFREIHRETGKGLFFFLRADGALASKDLLDGAHGAKGPILDRIAHPFGDIAHGANEATDFPFSGGF